MAIVTTDNQNYQDIADALREKGATGTFTPAQMADAILGLETDSNEIGDIVLTAEEKEEPEWLECDGQYVEHEDFPELWSKLRTTPDIAWQEKPNLITNPTCMCCGNGVYVIIDNDSYVWTASSIDGTWTRGKRLYTSSISGDEGWDIAFGDGVFVAIAQGVGAGIWYSDDPADEDSWQKVTDAGDSIYRGCCFFAPVHKFYTTYSRQNASIFDVFSITFIGGSPVFTLAYETRQTGADQYTYTGIAADSTHLAFMYKSAAWKVRVCVASDNNLPGAEFDVSLSSANHSPELPITVCGDSVFLGLFTGARWIARVSISTGEISIWEATSKIVASSYNYPFCINDLLFAEAVKDGTRNIWVCADIDNSEFEESQGCPRADTIFFDGTKYIGAGTNAIFVSPATASAKPLPTIARQYGVKAYIKASEAGA